MAFVAAKEGVMQAEEEKRVGKALLGVNWRACSIIGYSEAAEAATELAAQEEAARATA
jgi:hypothetical protein